VYRILGESGVQSRLEAVVPSRLTPLVGREEEVALLQQRWEQARAGQGQVVLLSGEAGIGKSRLVQVLKDHVAHEPHARIEWRGSSYHQQSALYPVIAHLHRLLQWREDQTPQEKLHTLETTLAASGLVLPEVVPLLAALLSLPPPAHYPALILTPQRQRQKTLETLLIWLSVEAKRQPVLVIVEDLHWIDPSTLELLSLLIDQAASARLCVVLTARPEFRPPWTGAYVGSTSTGARCQRRGSWGNNSCGSPSRRRTRRAAWWPMRHSEISCSTWVTTPPPRGISSRGSASLTRQHNGPWRSALAWRLG
jgi:ABC-type transport system involved in cytochrome c biogenesis ATPase subunit